MAPPIILLTDFGVSDPFVGIMKGVILGRCPQAAVVDLTHAITPQDVALAAFTVAGSVQYFPEGSIFVCVVDPGVGSGRGIVWAKSGSHQFLAPDNGLLSWTARRRPFREIRTVSNKALFLPEVGATFHGRDVFAPVAAALASGTPPAELGPVVPSLKTLPFPAPRASRGAVMGEILAIDRFGNAITNLEPASVKKGAVVKFEGRKIGPLSESYSSVDPGKPVVVTGSFGYVELSIRDGDFAARFKARRGAPVEVRWG